MPRLTLEEKEKKLLQKLREVKREKARLKAQKELKITNAKVRKEETEKMHQRIGELHLKDFWDYRIIAKKLNYHPVYVNKIINKVKRERVIKY